MTTEDDTRRTGSDQAAGDDGQSQFTDMLQELRVVQTGVQILSAFLLTLPFTNRWEHTGGDQRFVYALSVVAAAAATALVIGPVSFRRTRFGSGDKRRLLSTSARLARAGLVALLVAAVSAVFLALDVGLGRSYAIFLTVPVGALFVGIWYVLPALAGRDSAGDR
jgi:4-amino-4-deoxy-L-arabinose transferase-like glycosyltransferase